MTEPEVDSVAVLEVDVTTGEEVVRLPTPEELVDLEGLAERDPMKQDREKRDKVESARERVVKAKTVEELRSAFLAALDEL